MLFNTKRLPRVGMIVLGGLPVVALQQLLNEVWTDLPALVWVAIGLGASLGLWWLAGLQNAAQRSSRRRSSDRQSVRRNPATWTPVVGGALATAIVLLILNAVVLSDYQQPARPLDLTTKEPASELQGSTAEVDVSRQEAQPTHTELEPPDLDLSVAEILESLEDAKTTLDAQERAESLYMDRTIVASGVVSDVVGYDLLGTKKYRVHFRIDDHNDDIFDDHVVIAHCLESQEEIPGLEAGYLVSIRGRIVEFDRLFDSGIMSLDDCELLSFRPAQAPGREGNTAPH